MKNPSYDDAFDYESEDLPPAITSRIEHMSRKWAEEEEEDRRIRHLNRRANLRRRIEDWREDRYLDRQFDDLHDD